MVRRMREFEKELWKLGSELIYQTACHFDEGPFVESAECRHRFRQG